MILREHNGKHCMRAVDKAAAVLLVLLVIVAAFV
jgi:hypothetical protein